MHQQEQIDAATALGRIGRLSGRKAPAQCTGVMQLLASRKGLPFGTTPDGEATTLAIMQAWNSGFQQQHREEAGLAEVAA